MQCHYYQTSIILHKKIKGSYYVRFKLFSCDQEALWMVQSVHLSVCHTFFTMFPSSYHHEIFRSYCQWQKWCPYKSSRSEVKGQGHKGQSPFSRFWTVTTCLNSHGDEIMPTAWCCLGEVPYYFSRSSVKFQGHTTKKIISSYPNWAFPDCNSSLNSPMAMKWCTKLEAA